MLPACAGSPARDHECLGKPAASALGHEEWPQKKQARSSRLSQRFAFGRETPSNGCWNNRGNSGVLCRNAQGPFVSTSEVLKFGRGSVKRKATTRAAVTESDVFCHHALGHACDTKSRTSHKTFHNGLWKISSARTSFCSPCSSPCFHGILTPWLFYRSRLGRPGRYYSVLVQRVRARPRLPRS